MVHLAAEKTLGRAHDPFTAREHAVDPIPRMVPERQPHHASLAIGAAERVPVEFSVLTGGSAEEIDLLTVVEAAGDHVALAVILGDLAVGERLRHGGSFALLSEPRRADQEGVVEWRFTITAVQSSACFVPSENSTTAA